ncbi:hypothetical protein PLESTB_001498500 [Pleodorina starrii]|uniref:Uncharacterized protein n=1 Tax=Pleodorina starrii TaxID=330485 RepID=A0A9W6BXA3_9CHLO|nr:hypothetical protein PLESTB_001498500 [Pleodorina starrii]
MELRLAPKHKALLEAGRAPPALPRCNTLKLTLLVMEGWEAETNAALLRLFVLRLRQDVRERITCLVVYPDRRFKGVCLAISDVLTYLPALTNVQLRLYEIGQLEPLQWQVLHETLATLPRLESLSVTSLPDGALAGVARGALGKRLKYLAFLPDPSTPEGDFRSLAEMEQLTELKVDWLLWGHDLDMLLESLPPQLQKLELPYLFMTLNAGTISTVEAFKYCWDDDQTARLLRCRAMDRRLDRLKLKKISVSQAGRPALAELVRRCDVVEVDEVHIEPGVTEDAIRATLQLLQRWPRRFGVFLQYNKHDKYAYLAVPWRGEPLAQPAASRLLPQLHRQHGEGQELQDERVLKSRMWFAIGCRINAIPNTWYSGIQQAPCNTNASEGRKSSGISSTDASSYDTKVVLLRGPRVAQLVSEPELLDAWLRNQWGDALAAARWEGYRDTTPYASLVDYTDSDGRYLTLPELQAVLVCFPHPMLVRCFRDVAASSSPYEQPAIQVVPVPKEQYEGSYLGEYEAPDAYLALVRAVGEVIDRLWAEVCSEAAAAPGGTRDRIAAQLHRISRVSSHFTDLLGKQTDIHMFL